MCTKEGVSFVLSPQILLEQGNQVCGTKGLLTGWQEQVEKLRFAAVWFFLQATNEVVSRVPKATASEMEAAVASCKKAFWNWSETSVLSRQQIFLRYQQLIKDNLVRQHGFVWWLLLNVLQLILGIGRLGVYIVLDEALLPQLRSQLRHWLWEV